MFHLIYFLHFSVHVLSDIIPLFPAGVWWRRVSEIPRSSYQPVLSVSNCCFSHFTLLFPSYSTSFSFVLIPVRNVSHLTEEIFCFPLRCSSVKSHTSSSAQQHHQSAAKDLTSATGPASCSSSPTQTTYLTASAQQRSKRSKHFLELKNFKDNYNTLESTFWKACHSSPMQRWKKAIVLTLILKCAWMQTVSVSPHCSVRIMLILP